MCTCSVSSSRTLTSKCRAVDVDVYLFGELVPDLGQLVHLHQHLRLVLHWSNTTLRVIAYMQQIWYIVLNSRLLLLIQSYFIKSWTVDQFLFQIFMNNVSFIKKAKLSRYYFIKPPKNHFVLILSNRHIENNLSLVSCGFWLANQRSYWGCLAVTMLTKVSDCRVWWVSG